MFFCRLDGNLETPEPALHCSRLDVVKVNARTFFVVGLRPTSRRKSFVNKVSHRFSLMLMLSEDAMRSTRSTGIIFIYL